MFTILKTQRGAGAKISPVSIVFYEEGRMRGRVRSLVERTMREIISGCLVGGWAGGGPVGLPLFNYSTLKLSAQWRAC